MSVYKPQKSRYYHYDFVFQGHRFHGSTGQTTKRRALEVEQAKRVAAAKGEPVRRPEVPTLDQAAQRYWEEHGQHQASAKSIDENLALVVRLIGRTVLITEIDGDIMARAIVKRRGVLVKRGKRRDPPTNSTINRTMIDSTVRPMLNRARKVWGVKGLQEIDWAALRLEEPPPQPKDISAAEMAKLNEVLEEHWREFRRFQSRYALRLGEMFFPPSAVDLDGATVTVWKTVRRGTRKNNRPHIIPLLEEDVMMLRARISRAEAAGLTTVWYRERKRSLRALTYSGALRAFMKGVTDSGLRESKGARGSHSLRHHGGMQILRHTGNLRVAQKLLGHVSIQSTLTYAHAMDQDLREGLEAVSRNSPEPAEMPSENGEKKQRAK